MKRKRIRVGIIGCGAIGSGIAQSVAKELNGSFELTGVFDIHPERAQKIAQELHNRQLFRTSLNALIQNCDLLVEAVTAKDTASIIREALQKGRSVLAMSVGRLLNAPDLFRLAKKKNCFLLVPSGAIAGIDAIKAVSHRKIATLTLTTRKPPAGLEGNAYLTRRSINLKKLKKETVVFRGSVAQAIKYFPKNINVAATLALASGASKKILIQIITSPKFKTNSHEICCQGDFGTITTRTDNVPCPENPKTSALAVYSGIQSLRQFGSGTLIGT